LTSSMSAHDCVVHARPGLSCWRILLPPTWEAYLSMLSKPTRRRVRWAEKKLRDTKNCSVKVVRNEAELESAWRVLVDLHQRRRGSLGQAGCFSSDRFGCFLKEVASRLLSSGDLHMAWVEVQGRPIAAGLNLRGGKVTYAYQVGIDPDALEQNPGWLVNTAAIRQAIEEGHHGFDLLRGDEPYKGHLRAEPRAVHEIRIVPDRLRSQLLHTAWRTGTTVKDWLKTGLALTGMR